MSLAEPAAIDSALVRGLPLPDAARLVFVRAVSSSDPRQTAGVSVNEFLAWRDGARCFDVMSAMLSGQQDFAGDEYGAAERLRGLSVTRGLFTMLGVAPLAGRVFDSSESRLVDPAPAIVISERLWRRRYGADPRAIGAAVRVGGLSRTIVGVMPQAFRFQDVAVDFWVPLRLIPDPAPGPGRPLRVIARLEADMTRAQAQAELERLAVPMPQRPGAGRGWRPDVQPLEDALYGWARRPLTHEAPAVPDVAQEAQWGRSFSVESGRCSAPS